ncbi:MAG TPA: hypothetical protein VFS15_15125 [Kofleriaceae bacterium]|nr:hypothetical protein [Kofleriaceae bacterium]
MQRLAVLGLVCAAATARAEDRVELAHVPDLGVVEQAFPLDRHVPYEQRKRLGVTGSAALGIDAHGGAVASATAAAGQGTENVIAGLRSELIAGPDGIVRGRHRGLLELRSDWDDDLVGSLALSGRLDHGDARGLALPRLGVGRHTDADVALDGMVRIGSDKGDFQWVAIARGEAGITRWLDAPALDRANRRALTLGTGKTSFDGEIPRGSIDLIRGRVEHAQIRRPFVPAGAGSLDTEVRSVELGLGTHDLTFHIDHELLAVIAVDLGWTWLEADTSAGRLAESAFRMRLGTGIEWRDERSEFPLRRIGVGLGRVPTYTPDGQRLVSEWRLELDQGLETRRFVLGARGGVTFLSPIAGRGADTLVGYGAQLDAAIKLGAGIEAGAYNASTYQPRLAGDPWGSPRHWAIEAGVLARLRR